MQRQRDGSSARQPLVRLAAALLMAAGLAALPVCPAAARPVPEKALRVCAEGHNLPFSDRRGGGFENQIASLIARRLGRSLQYVWLPPGADLAAVRPGSGTCDAVIAEPRPAPAMDTTVPYYWSSYVLVSRTDRHLHLDSLKDPRLGHLRIGVEAIGRAGFYTPPARVLVEEGLADRLVPFPVIVAPAAVSAPVDNPRVAMLRAVADGQIDVAAVWGPAVGYFARRSSVPLSIAVIRDGDAFSSRKNHFGLQAMQFQISMGVRQGNQALLRALDAAIEHERPAISKVLERYGVPLIDPGSPALARSPTPAVNGPAHRPHA